MGQVEAKRGYAHWSFMSEHGLWWSCPNQVMPNGSLARKRSHGECWHADKGRLTHLVELKEEKGGGTDLRGYGFA